MASTKGITVKKNENFSEWFSQIVQKAELADSRYGIKGFVVHRPWGFYLIKKIYQYLEEAIENDGHEAFLFPMAVKAADLTKEEEHAGFTPDVFWITEAGTEKLEEKFALRPTGEAQIYPMYSLWFRSHKELPFKGYQTRIPAFRNDSGTRPFIRGREFMFFESHDVFNTHAEALAQVKTDLKICNDVVQDLIKIPYLHFKRPQWDKFKGANNTFTPDSIAPDGKRLQLASTHDLGQNFSKAYNISVRGADGEMHNPYQTCFGPGIWRIMAALIAIHGDDQGLIIPFDMAPKQVVIVPVLIKGKEEKVLEACMKIADTLGKAKIRYLLDDRDSSPGEKYNEWEMKGVPIRLEVGPREADANQISMAIRDQDKREVISAEELINVIQKESKALDERIDERAKKYFSNNTRDASTIEEVKKILLEHKGFIRIPFCCVDWDGESCADTLKAETAGGNVCGTLYPEEEKVEAGMKCAVCGKEAKHIVYVAKSY